GLGDDGTYQVAVRLTTEFGGQTFTDVGSANVLIRNTAPTLTLTGGPTAEVGVPYTLDLSATDPGADTVQTWAVNWGDGSPVEVYAGPAATVRHVYAAAGSFTVGVTATDEDGTYGPTTKGATGQA